jgi:hypothetical protein
MKKRLTRTNEITITSRLFNDWWNKIINIKLIKLINNSFNKKNTKKNEREFLNYRLTSRNAKSNVLTFNTILQCWAIQFTLFSVVFIKFSNLMSFSSTIKERVLIFWHHFGYLNTTLRLDWHPLAESGKNPSLTSSLASIRASTCCKRARTSEKRSITTQLRRPPICVDHSVALTTQLRWPASSVDHPAALTTQLRWPPSCVDHPAALTTHLRKKIYYHSAAPTIHLRRPPTYADHPPAPTTHLRRPEKAVPIQPSRKSRSHSTQIKKPSPSNPAEKAVPR